MKIVRINAIWCPACIVMKKIWKKIEDEYSNYEYIDYDYDIDEEIIAKYQIGDILPVAIFFENNEEIGRITGEKTEKEILEYLKF